MNDIYLKDKKENPDKKQFIYVIPGISKDILSLLDYFCRIKPKFHLHFYNLDFVCLFNLIQAAHFLKIKYLMDISCPTLALALTVDKKSPNLKYDSLINPYYYLCILFNLVCLRSLIIALFSLSFRNIVFTDQQLSECDCSRLLRSRPKDTFINPSDFLDVHFSPFVLRQLHSIKRGVCIPHTHTYSFVLVYVCHRFPVFFGNLINSTSITCLL